MRRTPWQVYYELEPQLLLQLYAPSPAADGARLAPLLQSGLSPKLRVVVRVAPARWVAPLVLALLGAVAHAVGSVLEMPRGYAPEHQQALLERRDVRQLARLSS